jgi:hypothetical protein
VRLLLSGNFVTEVQNQHRKRKGSPRVLLRRPLLKLWSNWSPRRINTLAKGLHASRYLEVGVEYGYTAENIRVRDRVGVDPAPMFDVEKLPRGFSFFAVESDAYFASLAPDVTFDLAFLDGLHTFEQTKADLFNVLRHVPNGVILVDDTVPSDEIAALPTQEESLARRRVAGSDTFDWMGDVWKLVVYIDRCLPQLDFRTIVGSGNVQTLVWRRQPGEVIYEPGGDGQATIAGLSYEEFFRDGIPAQFKPSREAEAIRACLAEVTRHPRLGQLHQA